MAMSLLFYRRPSPAWTVAGTGAQFESDVRLSDGNPGVLTTLRWLSTVSPVVGDYVAIRGDWLTAATMRGAWMLALSLEGGEFPAGVKFEVRGKRAGDVGYPYALGGNSLTEVSREMPDGSIGICWLFDDDLDPIVGIEIRIFNDANGATWADADTYVRIGEADVSEGIELCIAHGWSTSRDIRTQGQRTLGSQLHEVARVDFRVLEFALAPALDSAARLAGLANGTDWERIASLITRAGARTMVYVRTQDMAGAFSSAELHASAIFGKAKPQAIVHVQGSRDRYTSGYRVEEVPAII
jgi:hypothetical protein